MTTFTALINQVESLYVGYFGRAGDPNGTNFWVNQIQSGSLTLAKVAASFSVQTEATSKYPYLANPTISDPGTFVDQVYQNMFNHVADAAGKAFWVAQLTAASGNPAAIGSMILNIISGATGVDSTVISNKVDVSQDFTVQATNAGTTWNTAANAQSSSELATVTDTAASVTAAKAATTAYIGSAPGPQQTFTLNGNSLTSSAQNANFNAPLLTTLIGTQVQSLQIGDSGINSAPLTGPGLSNGGTFTGIFNTGAVPLVTLQGIPTHTDTVTAAGGAGYSGNITGLVTLNNVSSTGALTIGLGGQGIDKGGVAGTTTTGATLLSTVNVNNVVGATAAAATTVWMNTAALAGAADALTINVTGAFGTTATTFAGSNTISVKNDTSAAGAADNAYETLTVNAAAATNIALADGASGFLSTTTVNVLGAGAAVLWSSGGADNNFKNVTTVNASTDTGGVTVTGANSAGTTGFLTGAVLTSFKGGTGVDSLDISGMTAAQVQAITAGNLDGGAGIDTLILGSNAGGTGAANSTVALNNSNFENIGITALGGTVDLSKFGAGVTTFTESSGQAAAAVFNNLTSGLTFAMGANAGGFGDTFNSTGTALTDTFSFTHTGGTAVGALIFNGFETINETLATNAGGTAMTSITAAASAGGNVTYNLIDNSAGAWTYGANPLTIGTGGTLNISGTGVGAVSLAAATAVTAGAINASTSATSGLVMSLTVGDTSAISIQGSAGADTLTGSAFADIISAGSGNDIITGLVSGAGGGVSAFDQMTGGAGFDNFIARGDIAGAGTPAASYVLTTAISDMAVGATAATTDFISVSLTKANYATFGADLKATAAAAQGTWTVQSLAAGAGANAILTNAGATTLLKLTTGAAAGASVNATFATAIGSTTVTGITKSKSYFFTMYDTTNSKMDVGIVKDSNTNTKIDNGDTVALIASVNMSAADYASITTNHFALIPA